jgi:amino acid transporter
MDAGIFHKLTLVAFLAWVGLGADGLSSSSYGPEELYRTLGSQHGHLALYLALATALTVFIIAASYSQIIKLFPTGGGGYVVASKLLSPGAGVVSGSALIVDYVLTIALSIAAGVDAVFSFLPPQWVVYKVVAEGLLIFVLIWINMRGLKESIQALLPIFILFVITHIILVSYGIFGQSGQLPAAVHGAFTETTQTVQTLGWFGFLALMLRAYSLGAGTYTGIEAVSNGLSNLREPRVQTGRKTMMYMAVSLSITAAGILLGYMFWNVQIPRGGTQTLNAILCQKIMGNWTFAGFRFGPWLMYLTLASEGLLLFIAAQTGFVDGPNVLSNMAIDSWVPHRFANLSSRLVRQNGILVMGLSSLLILILAGGSVHAMIVLYAINVFITFSLSQLSMCLHWLEVRKTGQTWFRPFLLNGVGLALTGLILLITATVKFEEGGWITLAITGGLVLFCYFVKYHYNQVGKALKRLDDLLINLPSPSGQPNLDPCESMASTAVLLVNGYNGLGIHSIYSTRKLFRDKFKNFIFISVGQVDSSQFKGAEEMENLKKTSESMLQKYVALAQQMGYASEAYSAIGTDVPNEIEQLCDRLAARFPDATFFAGKLIFARENVFSKILHNETALELQRRLLFKGQTMVVLPIRVL